MTERDAIQGLEKLGARLRWDDGKASVIRVALIEGEYSRADLSLLAKLQTLQGVDLSFSKIGAGGFEEIGRCANLKWLKCRGMDVSDDDLKAIEGLQQLRGLSLSGSASHRIGVHVSANGFESISKLRSLDFLSVIDGTVAAEGLKLLARLPNLKTLAFSEVPITDECMEGIGQITTLKEFSIGNSAVSDAGFLHLKELGLLEGIDFGGSRGITDAGLETLGMLPKLQKIRTNGRLSQEAKERFRMKYPHIALDTRR